MVQCDARWQEAELERAMRYLAENNQKLSEVVNSAPPTECTHITVTQVSQSSYL